jgi:hypothetical protein
MSANWDLAVIGAGPAGMTAAMTAARLGLKVGLLDEQPRPGGQIYRNPAQPTPEVLEALGTDYAHGMELIERFRAADIDYRPGSTVWDIMAEGEIAYLRDGRSEDLRARHVLLATGAIERPVPLPGWTLPGVMTVGAAQILLKTGGYVPDRPAVLVGGGPLLYLVAWQYLQAGAQIEAILETVPRANLWSALPHAPGMLSQGRLLAKGRRWLRDLRAARVRRIRGVTEVRIERAGGARPFRPLSSFCMRVSSRTPISPSRWASNMAGTRSSNGGSRGSTIGAGPTSWASRWRATAPASGAPRRPSIWACSRPMARPWRWAGTSWIRRGSPRRGPR